MSEPYSLEARPVARLLLKVGDLKPVDVCPADLYQDPRRLALLVEVALAVELKALKEGPAYERVRRGQE